MCQQVSDRDFVIDGDARRNAFACWLSQRRRFHIRLPRANPFHQLSSGCQNPLGMESNSIQRSFQTSTAMLGTDGRSSPPPYATGAILPHIAGNHLTLHADESPSLSLDATIIKTFEPFTLSCALVIQVDSPLLQLSGKYVLKLFDRRFDAPPGGTWGRSLESGNRKGICRLH